MDGAQPHDRLVQASDGNFYGTAAIGGTNNYGVVFKVTPGGAESLLYSFAGGLMDGADPRGGLVQGSDGNFYGVTTYGDTNNVGLLFEMTPGGTETVLHSFTGGPTDGADAVRRFSQASDGTLYGSTITGGANGEGAIIELN